MPSAAPSTGMTLISSRATAFYKRGFPVLWFGVLIALIFLPLIVGFQTGQSAQPMFFVVPIAMMAIGYYAFKRIIFTLVDQVYDLGDALLVRNGAEEERIALIDITNVGYSPMMNPPQVTLSLRQPSVFGAKVTFCAPIRFVAFGSSPMVDELIQRVDAARRRAGK
jgi:hypothetical protein